MPRPTTLRRLVSVLAVTLTTASLATAASADCTTGPDCDSATPPMTIEVDLPDYAVAGKPVTAVWTIHSDVSAHNVTIDTMTYDSPEAPYEGRPDRDGCDNIDVGNLSPGVTTVTCTFDADFLGRGLTLAGDLIAPYFSEDGATIYRADRVFDSADVIDPSMTIAPSRSSRTGTSVIVHNTGDATLANIQVKADWRRSCSSIASLAPGVSARVTCRTSNITYLEAAGTAPGGYTVTAQHRNSRSAR